MLEGSLISSGHLWEPTFVSASSLSCSQASGPGEVAVPLRHSDLVTVIYLWGSLQGQCLHRGRGC